MNGQEGIGIVACIAKFEYSNMDNRNEQFEIMLSNSDEPNKGAKTSK